MVISGVSFGKHLVTVILCVSFRKHLCNGNGNIRYFIQETCNNGNGNIRCFFQERFGNGSIMCFFVEAFGYGNIRCFLQKYFVIVMVIFSVSFTC